jgi:hypothetical protein
MDDRFDGGCPADVGTETKADPFMQTVEAYGERMHNLGILRGMNDALRICVDAGNAQAAELIEAALVRLESKPA